MQENGTVNEITSRDYIRVLFRQKWAIILTIATVMATAVLGVMLRTPEYEAQVKMLISGQKQTQAEYYSDIGMSGLRSEQITLTQSEIVTSDPVLERAVTVLGLAKKPLDYEARFASKLKGPVVKYFAGKFEKKLEKLTKEQRDAYSFRMAVEDLRERLKVSPVRDTDLFLIKVHDYNPLAAAVMANVVSRSYTIFDLEQQLAEIQLKYGEKHLAVIQLKEAIEKMSKSLNGARLPPLSAIGPATVKIIEQAKVPLKPSGISKVLTLILAAFLSVFLSIMVAFGIENMDQTFKSPKDAESFLGINYLGSLMKKTGKNGYHDLAEQIYLLMREKNAKAILFTSTMSYEGVTSVVFNLGSYMAENLNKKVLLIDGNLRNPALYRMAKLPLTNHTVDMIEGRVSLADGIKHARPNLDVLTIGSANGEKYGMFKRLIAALSRKPLPGMLFNPINAAESDVIKNFIKQGKEQYDVVLVDSAPFGEVKETAMMSSFADGVIVVINERKTRRHVVKYAMESFQRHKANILGMVVNNRQHVIPKAIYDRI